MSDRLCAFAKNGDPNVEGYTEWTTDTKKALTLGDNDTVAKKPSMAKLWITMFTNEAPGE